MFVILEGYFKNQNQYVSKKLLQMEGNKKTKQKPRGSSNFYFNNNDVDNNNIL